MLPTDTEALRWLRAIRLALIARKVRVSETIQYPLGQDGLRSAQRAKPNARRLDTGTPEGAITSAIARASRSALRFLRWRGATRDDREDILHEAILWCLENQHRYSLTTTLETWFFNAVRDAYKRLKRHQSKFTNYSEVSDGNL